MLPKQTRSATAGAVGRHWRAGALALVLAVSLQQLLFRQDPARATGCEDYTPAPALMLVAHAGGGLPDRTYANSIDALDLAYSHGLRLFEIDFYQPPIGPVRIAHDFHDLVRTAGGTSPGRLFRWFRAHPGTTLVTDFKSDNISGLRWLARKAPDLQARVVPQIYQPEQYAQVRALGYERIIFTLYRNRDPDWLSFANSAKLFAVTLPEGQAAYASRLEPPVFLHTVNEPARQPHVTGLYTDCLVPPSPANGV